MHSLCLRVAVMALLVVAANGDEICSATGCFGYSCDDFDASYTCAELETEYACACGGCTCTPRVRSRSLPANDLIACNSSVWNCMT